jgi:hypothetical protein
MPFGLLFIDHNRSGAGPGAVSEAQRRAFGGNGFFFMFPPNDLHNLRGQSPMLKPDATNPRQVDAVVRLLYR